MFGTIRLAEDALAIGLRLPMLQHDPGFRKRRTEEQVIHRGI